jgi:predicted O-methyltransferase YrrM
MWFKIKGYLKFLWHSKNQHGIHSPFVYKLITQCFYNKNHFKVYGIWDNAQIKNLESKEILKVENLGAKSKVFERNKRAVSTIAEQASISKKRARLMIRLVDYLSVENALELGTSIGLGSFSISGNGKTNLTTVEACQETSAFASQLFKSEGLENISALSSSFSEYLENLCSRENSEQVNSINKFDLVFINGHHDGKDTLNHFESLLAFKHNDSLFIFNDIHLSPSMEETWEQIKVHENVKVTIDTFKWGLVFFRQEQVKQDFVIRV